MAIRKIAVMNEKGVSYWPDDLVYLLISMEFQIGWYSRFFAHDSKLEINYIRIHSSSN